MRANVRAAWERNVGRLDAEGLVLVEGLRRARRRELDGPLPDRAAELTATERRAVAYDRALGPGAPVAAKPRGRPRRSDIDEGALVDALRLTACTGALSVTMFGC